PTILALNQTGTGTFNIGANTSVKATASIGKTNTTGFGTSSNYLQLGQGENGVGGTRLIGLGYSITANTYQPAYIGYVETSNSGETNGDLVFGTRSVTTDTAPTTRLTVKASGDVISSGTLGINGVANSVTSGTYTPTLTNGTNVSASSPIKGHYIRVGNEVTTTVSFSYTVTSGSVGSAIDISIPIASNFNATGDLVGDGQTQGNAGNVFAYENATDDRATVTFLPTAVGGSGTMNVTFIYTVK
ncbi:MAG: hypothetical protein WC810_26655, partial [Janthinobacterium sp.]